MAKCGSSYPKKAAATIKKSKTTSVKISKLGGKKIDAGKTYKVKVKAFRTVNGKKTYVQSSYTLHIAGKNHRKLTNAAKVKAKKTSYRLKQGKTVKLFVSVKKQSGKKKLLNHGAKLRYWSTNKAVATVSRSGKIKAVRAGSCYVYAMTADGAKVRVKVTVPANVE